jgi:hypothetical protein
MGRRFSSNEEYFEAVIKLADDLEQNGNHADSELISHGFSCINGLTDGWAMHLKSLLEVERNRHNRLTPHQKQEVRDLADAAYYTVYRHKRMCPFLRRVLTIYSSNPKKF